MGFTQEKDIIIYKGTKYNFTYNLTTRHADGDIDRLLKCRSCIEKWLIAFFMKYPQADGIYEVILKHASYYYLDMYSLSQWYTSLQPHITEIKKNMKKIMQTDEMNLRSPHNWLTALFTLDLTDLEKELYYRTDIRNRQVLKKYAYQYAKYKEYLTLNNFNNKIEGVIKVDGKIEMPSNIMDFLLKVDQRYTEIKDIYLNTGMQEYYNKYKNYNFTDGKYVYIIPSSVAQVKEEADQQNNCVYNLYLKPMVDGTSKVIIFVRKIEEPDKSYITLEYNPDGKNLIQCNLKNNKYASTDEREYILKQLLQR